MDTDSILAEIAAQDGGLLEVCVLDACLEDWKRAIAGLADLGFVSEFTRAGVTTELVVRPEMFSDGDDVSFFLKLVIGRQNWTTGFYSEHVIDFQGDPGEVVSAVDLEDTLRLMNTLHESVGKRVILVPESLQPDRVQPYLAIG
jgi:hypothetical protein